MKQHDSPSTRLAAELSPHPMMASPSGSTEQVSSNLSAAASPDGSDRERIHGRPSATPHESLDKKKLTMPPRAAQQTAAAQSSCLLDTPLDSCSGAASLSGIPGFGSGISGVSERVHGRRSATPHGPSGKEKLAIPPRAAQQAAPAQPSCLLDTPLGSCSTAAALSGIPEREHECFGATPYGQTHEPEGQGPSVNVPSTPAWGRLSATDGGLTAGPVASIPTHTPPLIDPGVTTPSNSGQPPSSSHANYKTAPVPAYGASTSASTHPNDIRDGVSMKAASACRWVNPHGSAPSREGNALEGHPQSARAAAAGSPTTAQVVDADAAQSGGVGAALSHLPDPDTVTEVLQAAIDADVPIHPAPSNGSLPTSAFATHQRVGDIHPSQLLLGGERIEGSSGGAAATTSSPLVSNIEVDRIVDIVTGVTITDEEARNSACSLCGARDNLVFTMAACFCNNRSSLDEFSCFMSQVLLGTAGLAQLPPSSRWESLALRCPISNESDARRLVMVEVNTTEVAILAAAVALRLCPGYAVHQASVDGNRVLAPWLLPSRLTGTVTAARARVTRRVGKVAPNVVPIAFPNVLDHLRHFAKLVALAAEEDVALQLLQTKRLTVRWRNGVGDATAGYFEYNTDSREDLRVGSSVVLTSDGGDNTAPKSHRGAVVWTSGATVGALFDPSLTPSEGPWDIRPEAMTVAIDREQTALHMFAFDALGTVPHLQLRLLGQPIPFPMRISTFPVESFDVPGKDPLTATQSKAVRAALTDPLVTLQGPPGTGKTKTAVAIIYHLVQQRRGPVLVCTGSNPAATHIAAEVAAAGISVIRFVAPQSRSRVVVPERLSVDHFVKPSTQLSALQEALNRTGWLPPDQKKAHHDMQQEAYQEALAAVSVIVCTCSAAAQTLLANLTFKHVLIDEAGQVTEPLSLVPVTKGCQSLVLVGDHKQLPPLVKCVAAKHAGLAVSLFERMVRAHPSDLHFLDVQHRMHSALSAAPNEAFYDGRLNDADDIDEIRRSSMTFPWPTSKPLLFWHHEEREQRAASSSSYLNTGEATSVVAVVRRLVQCGVGGDAIGVISPYDAQKVHVRTLLASHDPALASAVEIDTVDGFQGREKDFMIITTTRSNTATSERAAVGHVSDPRRTCVMLTRARKGEILIGNSTTLSQAPLWSSILAQWRDVTCYGSLDNLQPFAPPETRSVAIGEPDFRQLFVPPCRSTFPGTCQGLRRLVCMCGGDECRPTRDHHASRHTLWAKGYLRQQPFPASKMWALVEPIPLFDENSSPLYGSFECAECSTVELPITLQGSPDVQTFWEQVPVFGCFMGDVIRVYSDSECESAGWRRDADLTDTPLMGYIGYNHDDDDAGSPVHTKILDCLLVAQASATAALAIELQYSAEISFLPAGQTPSGMPRIPSLVLALLRRTQWFWRARVVGYMTSAQTLLYWRYANSTRADSPSTFAAFVRTTRWEEGAYERLTDRGIWQDRFPDPLRRPKPESSARGVLRLGTGTGSRRTTFAGGFYRQVRFVECLYGGRACLGEMATQADLDEQSRIGDIHIEFYELYCAFVQEADPTGCVVTGFANPGVHTWGVVQAGFHAVGLDTAVHLEDFRKWFYDILPRRNPRAPTATILRGDALIASERAAAIEEHPVADHCIASFDTPCCRSYTTLQLNVPRPMIVGAPGRRTTDALSSARRENLGECIHKRHTDFETSGIPYVVETVQGNGNLPIPPNVTCTIFDGLCFGLRTRDTHRFYHPTDCPLFIDSALRDGSTRLAAKTCAGSSRVTQPRGPDGVPMGSPCCTGQLASFYNSGYTIHSRTELCKVIGVDPAHVTSKSRLNDGLPSKMARLATAESAGMGVALVTYGIPAIAFDDAKKDARLGAWLLGLLRARAAIRPVTRVVLIIQPPHFPGHVLVRDEANPPQFPCFSVGRSGFIDSVATGFHAAHPGITISRLTFVSDMLDADEPTVVFTCGSLADNDAHLLSKGPVGGLVSRPLAEVAADEHFMTRGLEQNLALASWLSLVSTNESAQTAGVRPLPGDLPTRELLSWHTTKQSERTTLERVAITPANITRCKVLTDLARASALRPMAVHTDADEGGKSKAKAAGDEIRTWWELGSGLALIDLSPTVWATHITTRLNTAHRLDSLLKATFDVSLLQLPTDLLATFQDGKYLVELHKLLEHDSVPVPRAVAEEASHSTPQDETNWELAAEAADEASSRDPDVLLASAASPFYEPSATVARNEIVPPTIIGVSPSSVPTASAAAVENPDESELPEGDSWVPTPEARLVQITDECANATALASATDIPFDLEADFEQKAGNGVKASALSLRAEGPRMPQPVAIPAVGIALQWGSRWVLHAHGPFQPSIFFRYENTLHKSPPVNPKAKRGHSEPIVMPQRTVDAAVSAIEPWFLGLASFADLASRVKTAVKETPCIPLKWITTARNQDGRLPSRSVPARRVEAKLWVVRIPENFDWTTPRPGFMPTTRNPGQGLIVGTTLDGRPAASVVAPNGSFDTVGHQRLPFSPPLPFSSTTSGASAHGSCSLYFLEPPDFDRLLHTCSGPAISALRLLAPPPTAAAMGKAVTAADDGAEDDESGSECSLSSGSSGSEDDWPEDTMDLLTLSMHKETKALGQLLSLRSEATSNTPLDLRHRFYITLFFASSVWEHISDKAIESRLLSPLYAKVEKGWLLCCRANGFSNCHWKLVEDGPFEYVSHSACARDHKSLLIPSLSDADIDAMDDTDLEWMFLQMHVPLITKRAALRWCHDTGTVGRVICWKVTNLPANVRLPSSRNHVTGSGPPSLHRPPRAHFRRMALTLRLRQDADIQRAAFRLQKLARRLFALRVSALVQVMKQLCAQAWISAFVRRGTRWMRFPRGDARLRFLSRFRSRIASASERADHRNVTRQLFLTLARRLYGCSAQKRYLASLAVEEAASRVQALTDRLLGKAAYVAGAAARFHRLVDRLQQGKRGSVIFAIRSRQHVLELYVHERYADGTGTGDTVLFAPAGKEDPVDYGSAVNTATRELKEETTLEVDASRLRTSWRGCGSKLGRRWALTDHTLLVSDTEADSMVVPESEKLKHPADSWVSLSHLLSIPPELCFDNFQHRAQRAFKVARQEQLRLLFRRFATVMRTRRSPLDEPLRQGRLYSRQTMILAPFTFRPLSRFKALAQRLAAERARSTAQEPPEQQSYS